MILGINGKIGSGKDTVGKIIQHLTSEWEDEEFQDTDMLDVRSNWEIKKFAGKLKQIASILTGIPVENFEDQEFKKLDMSPEWGMTYREFLQKLGTEAMREGLHTNVWVNALMADYITESFRSDKKTNWIITDVRFPNEMEAIAEKGGITIRVVRPGTVVGEHPSETSLYSAEFDYTIVNDSTIEELVKKVRDILVLEKLI
jgi:hypothetical protein